MVDLWYVVKQHAKRKAMMQEQHFFAGLTGAECEPAWSEQDGVYFSAVGRSFYEQCFPRNSVHVGFSSYSMVYISTRFVCLNTCR